MKDLSQINIIEMSHSAMKKITRKMSRSASQALLYLWKDGPAMDLDF